MLPPVAGDGHRDQGAEHHPAEMPAAGRPGAAVQAIDWRRLAYIESLLGASCFRPTWPARGGKFSIGVSRLARSDKPLPRTQQQAVPDEMLRMASR